MKFKEQIDNIIAKFKNELFLLRSERDSLTKNYIEKIREERIKKLKTSIASDKDSAI